MAGWIVALVVMPSIGLPRALADSHKVTVHAPATTSELPRAAR